ncbi:MAG: carboxypeptidase-like regulatory domain-containing protein [Terriglobales bacterium]
MPALALGAVAQAAALPPVPARPGWAWVRHYAALALAGDTQAWPAEFRAVAADGNRLNPAQQHTLYQAADAASQAAAALGAALEAAGSFTACPAAVKTALASLAAQLTTLQRDAQPPWTVHRHLQDLGSTGTRVQQFTYSGGCGPSYLPPDFRSPTPPPRQPPYVGPGAATLQGRVIESASKQPLPGAVVQLEGVGLDPNNEPLRYAPPKSPDAATRPWIANENVAEEVTTATGGDWSFVDVPPGCYWLTVYREGYLPLRDVAEVAGGHPHPCAGYVRRFAASKLVAAQGAITLALEPAPVEGMAYGALVAAHPLAFAFGPSGSGNAPPNSMRLSPDGRYFGFYLGLGIKGGEIWRYDRQTGALTRIGELSFGALPIIGWVGDQVAVEVPDRGQPQRPTPNYLADSAGLHVFTGSAAAFEAAFHRRALMPVDGAYHSGDHTVTVDVQGHGAVLLKAFQDGHSNPKTIASGSWGLQGAMLDTERGVVYYPEYDYTGKPEDLVAYDLNRQTRQRFAAPRSVERILDAVRVAKGVLFAYSANGPCDQPQALPAARYFDESQHYFPELQNQDTHARVCFMTVRDDQAQK